MDRREALEKSIELRDRSEDSRGICNATQKITSSVIFKNITESKIESIKKELEGLDRCEWSYIKDAIDMYFSNKAANIKIDDLTCLDNYLKRRY
ncbi:MAG: hypothetical protein E7D27_16165 [Clostridium celatum]|nr:hypothetical protein [Clostridium celatum]